MATLDSVLASGVYTLASRALVMDADLVTVLHVVPGHLLDGNVNMDRRREIFRQASVTLEDTALAYRPRTASDYTWPNRLWRLERGAVVDGQPVYRPLITGLVQQPEEAARNQQVSFGLVSRLALADQQFSSAVVLAAGSRLSAAVLAVGALAGWGTAASLYVLDDAGAVLLDARVYNEQDNMLQALAALCFDNGLDLGDDANGRITLAPFVDPSKVAVAWQLTAATASVLLDAKRSLRARPVYNRAIVVGVAADRYPVEAEARDLNPASPTYNPPGGGGPVGDRPRPRYVSADIHDQATANAVALRLLYEGALFEEAIAVQTMPWPGMEPRQVARIQAAGADDYYLLDEVTVPLRGGEQTMATRKVRSLLAP